MANNKRKTAEAPAIDETPTPPVPVADQKQSEPPKVIETFSTGVELLDDGRRGIYMIRLSPKMTQDEFREVINELKPMLNETRKFSGEGKANRETKFFYDGQTHSWNLTYRFRKKDENGNDVPKANGNGVERVDYRNQASIIAERVAHAADRIISEKLGLTKSDVPNF